MLTLRHPDAELTIEDQGLKYFLTVSSHKVVIPDTTWATAYPIDLISRLFKLLGPWIIDGIKRDEDPSYLGNDLYWDTLSFVNENEFLGKNLLDFGCGTGLSSIALCRMFPTLQITGVELDPERVEIAHSLAKYHNMLDRVQFLPSRSGSELPEELECYDLIMLSAVYEHLTSDERQTLLPQLWRRLKENGILFINQLPHRWFPIEHHTTGLPLINYMPNRIAFIYAKRFSKRVSPEDSWANLLRAGIRGSTEKEILKVLNRNGCGGLSICPTGLGVSDHIDLWYQFSNTLHPSTVKGALVPILRAIKTVTGSTMTPYVSLAIRKIQ